MRPCPSSMAPINKACMFPIIAPTSKAKPVQPGWPHGQKRLKHRRTQGNHTYWTR